MVLSPSFIPSKKGEEGRGEVQEVKEEKGEDEERGGGAGERPEAGLRWSQERTKRKV